MIAEGKRKKLKREGVHVRDADERANEGEEGRPDKRIGGERDGEGREGG